MVRTFTFVELFDTVGTLVGVAGKAKMLDAEGRLPGANRALLADSLAIAGVLACTFLEIATGRWRRLGVTMRVLSAVFVLRFFLQ